MEMKISALMSIVIPLTPEEAAVDALVLIKVFRKGQ